MGGEDILGLIMNKVRMIRDKPIPDDGQLDKGEVVLSPARKIERVGRLLKILAFGAGITVLLVALVACDGQGGGACYYEGNRITKVLDANGDEYKVQAHSLDVLGVTPCAVSAKAVPFKSSDNFFPDRWFEIPSSTEIIEVIPLIGTGRFIPIEGTWE